VAGQEGLQIFPFNGANPIKHYTGLLNDKSRSARCSGQNTMLYAIVTDSGKLFVFTNTPTSHVRAPGSPYAISSPERCNRASRRGSANLRACRKQKGRGKKCPCPEVIIMVRLNRYQTRKSRTFITTPAFNSMAVLADAGPESPRWAAAPPAFQVLINPLKCVLQCSVAGNSNRSCRMGRRNLSESPCAFGIVP